MLRALLADTSCDLIDFTSDMSIHLASPLWIETGRTVTIDGAGKSVNLTDNSFRRVITVAEGADATLQNISITQGSEGDYFVYAEGCSAGIQHDPELWHPEDQQLYRHR